LWLLTAPVAATMIGQIGREKASKSNMLDIKFSIAPMMEWSKSAISSDG
jgi:hypothetical protein